MVIKDVASRACRVTDGASSTVLDNKLWEGGGRICLWSYVKLGLIQILATLLRHIYNLKYNYSNQTGSIWLQGYSFFWQMNIIKTWEIPFISSTQSDACMSSSWLLGHAKGRKSEFLTLQIWNKPVKRDNPNRKYRSFRIAGGWAQGYIPAR
jgi:hypothetical protein